MLRLYSILILFIAFSTQTIAQDLDHYVIGSDGGHSRNNQFSLDYTIGEVVTEFGEDTLNNVHLTQGFQQTMLAIVSVEEHVQDIEIDVYPNPAVDHLNVSIPTLQEDMQFALFDMQGKLIEQQKINSEAFTIGFSTMSTGNYLLVFSNKDQRIKTLQVQKSH
jgi:hypothetical protein